MKGLKVMFHIFMVLVVWSVGTTYAQSEDDPLYYYDIVGDEDPFSVDCGTKLSPEMVITFRGDAVSLYASDAPLLCLATEIKPAVFRIDALNNADCPVSQQTSPLLNSIEMVVQATSVRMHTDSVHVVTCNYELGGQQQSSSKNTLEGNLLKKPEWITSDDMQAGSTVTLHVYDTAGQELTEATLGSYIQLKALFSTTLGSESERSLRVWNCRAFDGSDGLVDTDEYYMLLGGCGDGAIIRQDRGFYTTEEPDDVAIDRIALSLFFRTFAIPGKSQIQFECDYVVCTDPTGCDGKSCNTDKRRRRKRDADSGLVPRPSSRSSGLPKVRSPVITINKPRLDSAPVRTTNTLTKDDLVTGNSFYYYEAPDAVPAAKNPKFVPQRPAASRSLQTRADSNGDMNILTIGLLAGVISLSVMFMVTLVCSGVLCWKLLKRTNNPPQYPYHQTSFMSPEPSKVMY